MSARKKRTPVRTQTVDEDYVLRLAHILRHISRRSSNSWAGFLVRRAFAFNGYTVVLRDGKVVDQ